jgi:hypothetical protein
MNLSELYDEKPDCHVADDGCESPPNLMDEYKPSRLPTCYRCGNSVCKKCSRIVKYLNLGRKRICAYCEMEMELDQDEREMAATEGQEGDEWHVYRFVNGRRIIRLCELKAFSARSALEEALRVLEVASEHVKQEIFVVPGSRDPYAGFRAFAYRSSRYSTSSGTSTSSVHSSGSGASSHSASLIGSVPQIGFHKIRRD